MRAKILPEDQKKRGYLVDLEVDMSRPIILT
jgi:hypothetical protein